MEKIKLSLAVLFVIATVSCNRDLGHSVEQVPIGLVEKMPSMPQPYHIIDWKQRALDFDSYVYDFNSTLPAGPQIWLDSAYRNFPQITFGIHTAVKDNRQGPGHNIEYHESLNTLHTIMGAGLIGIDKTDQHGFNFVKMCQNYFNRDTGWNIMMGCTNPYVAHLGGGYGRDWWYDVFPNILYYAICDLFPGVEGAEQIQRNIADQFAKADSVLAGNYDHSFFDYAAMQGMDNHIPYQQDAAGGHGWVLYSAYKKFGDKKYLEHAKSAISVINNQTESRFYEILLPMGIYTAARLNAEEGTNYDISKMFDWVFDGCHNPENSRTGWGVICERWGNYDVHGLQGSIDEKYAFLMNSIDLAWAFVPIVKYQPQYARAIGKWMNNIASACRLFYPDQIPDENQCLPGMQEYTNSTIAYEGLRYNNKVSRPEYNAKRTEGIHPVALGDGPEWSAVNPAESMFSIYSSSAVGILAAIIDTTDVEGILRLDCNATDFYAEKKFPVYLMYNPFAENREVTYRCSEGCKDLFDIVSKQYLARRVEGETVIELPSDGAALIVEIPNGTKISKKNDCLIAAGQKITY